MKGINRVRKRLADGTVKTYYYARKGGPPLPGKPGSAEFVDAYNAAVARKVVKKIAPRQDVMLKIIRDHQNSQQYRSGIGEITRRNYSIYIQKIEEKFSDFPLSALVGKNPEPYSSNGETK
jgi:hypothetical protein